MDLEYIKREIDSIKTIVDDPEVAHVKEDRLYLMLIEYISKCTDVPSEIREKAQWIISSQLIDFDRWCG